MDGAPGLQSVSSERETWVDEEVDALLGVWGNTYIHVNRENLGKRHWETVVRDVNARLAHQREQPQMKNKIDSLKKRYKREKSSKGENDRNSITWKWYDHCDLLWGTPSTSTSTSTSTREIVGLQAPDVVELHHHQDSLSRLAPAPFLAAMAPEVNGDDGVKAGASSRMGGYHEERLPGVPPSPSCSRGNRGGEGNGNGCFHVNSSNAGIVEPGGKENVKRRKLNGGAGGGATVTTQSVTKVVQGLADTYATVEQARMF